MTPTTSGPDENLRDRLRRALPAAMKAQDRPAVSALRSALAAIDNAGAVDVPRAPRGLSHPQPAERKAPHPQPAERMAGHPEFAEREDGHPEFAGTVAGVGATEVERRSLTDSQMEEIVRAEIADREAAADGYERAGELEQARRLRGEAKVLSSILDTT